MNTTHRWILSVAGLLGFFGVALGAFGAHGRLYEILQANGSIDTWQTAVLYQLVHSVAVLAAGFWRDPGSRPAWVAGFWTAGIALFSGSLYILALGGPKFLGPVTPLGGVCFLVGWYLLFRSAWKQPAA